MKKYLVAGVVICVVFAGFGLKNYFNQRAIDDLREPIVSMLVDPMSAQFRNEKRIGENILCGEVNAKNQMGGYIGFKKFIRTLEFSHIDGSGINRFSSDIGKSTDDVIAALDVKIKIRENQIKNKEAGEAYRLSDREIDALVEKKLFEKNWLENCSG
ncbi:MAG: hypothetical protein ACEQSE_09325 [Candidatus Aquirickettsiella gammari]